MTAQYKCKHLYIFNIILWSAGAWGILIILLVFEFNGFLKRLDMQGHLKLALISRFHWVGYADGNNQEVNYRITSMKTKNGKKKQFD